MGRFMVRAVRVCLRIAMECCLFIVSALAPLSDCIYGRLVRLLLGYDFDIGYQSVGFLEWLACRFLSGRIRIGVAGPTVVVFEYKL